MKVGRHQELKLMALSGHQV